MVGLKESVLCVKFGGVQLVSAILARNEASGDRYLRRVLDRCRQFSDTIVLLDDGSTDETPKVAESMGAKVFHREHQPAAWGNEVSARQELWEIARAHARGWDDWVLICDADQLLMGDVRGLCLTRELNAWAMPLFDMWSETEYREDQYWQAHRTPRVWLVAPNRVPTDYVPQWNQRGVHPGHIPINWPAIVGVGPPDVYWLHLGWSKPEHREAKYQQYMRQAHQLGPSELAHVQSILQ